VRLLASISPGEMRVAAWDGTLQDYAISRPGAPDGVGELHRGRVMEAGPAATLLATPRTPEAAAYLRGELLC